MRLSTTFAFAVASPFAVAVPGQLVGWVQPPGVPAAGNHLECLASGPCIDLRTLGGQIVHTWFKPGANEFFSSLVVSQVSPS